MPQFPPLGRQPGSDTRRREFLATLGDRMPSWSVMQSWIKQALERLRVLGCTDPYPCEDVFPPEADALFPEFWPRAFLVDCGALPSAQSCGTGEWSSYERGLRLHWLGELKWFSLYQATKDVFDWERCLADLLEKHGSLSIDDLCKELHESKHSLERTARREHRDWRKRFLRFVQSCGEPPETGSSRRSRRSQARQQRNLSFHGPSPSAVELDLTREVAEEDGYFQENAMDE